jgi:hypothetical protein
MVTDVPTDPEAGEKIEMIGGPKGLFLITEIVLSARFVTAKSALPSPSKSPIDKDHGPPPVVSSTLTAKLAVVIEPLVLVLRYRETLLEA